MRRTAYVLFGLIFSLTAAVHEACAVDPQRPRAPSVLLDAAFGGTEQVRC
jgi:hypothetical protein